MALRLKLCFVLGLFFINGGIADDQDNVDSYLFVKICDICECAPGNETDGLLNFTVNILCIYDNQVLDLEKIIWPVIENGNIAAKFEGLGLSSLQRLASSSYITHLSLNDNNIANAWPSPFLNTENLIYLSISNNKLSEINMDMFENLQKLEELDLSKNKLSDFHEADFVRLTSLKVLRLDDNHIKEIPIQSLTTLQNLEYLSLSNNDIFVIEFSNNVNDINMLNHLKILDISSNVLTFVKKETFQKAIILERLNLSHNNIEYITKDTFKNCSALKTIDLSFNKIKSILSIPNDLEELHLSNNQIDQWPLLPEGLKVLDLSGNELFELYNENDISFDSIQVLNISYNKIQNFMIEKPLLKLEIFDISYNLFDSIPSYFGNDMTPLLLDLYIDGNPIKKLAFEKDISLRMLSAKYLTNLKELNSLNIKSKNEAIEEKEIASNQMNKNCVHLLISHCPELSSIEEGAFINMPLCYLDLSGNNLKSLSVSVADWASIEHGVNLQGNPWNCDCNLQWFLDEVLEITYKKHATLLHELRCDAPRAYRGNRFVHWYKWEEKAFCIDPKYMKRANIVLSPSTEDEEGLFGNNTVVVIVLVVFILIGLIMIGALIAYLARGKYRHNPAVMRQMKRKRQTQTDGEVVKQNGDHNVGLTSV